MLRLTAFLILTLAICIVSACGIGRLQPTPISDLFTNPDGSPCENPCLFGVKVGSMPAEEALRLLRSHPLTTGLHISFSEKRHSYLLEGEEASIILSVTEEGDVDGLQVQYMPHSANSLHKRSIGSDRLDQLLARLTLGHIVASMEPPCSQITNMDMGMEQIWLSFQHNDLTFGHRLSNPLGIELDDPIWFIVLHTSSLEGCNGADWTTWHGFKTFDLGEWEY